MAAGLGTRIPAAEGKAGLRLTILGTSPVRPNPGGACAGYLLDAGQGQVLVDCGPGVVSRLLKLTDPAGLAGIVISHVHPDHMLDLVGLRYGMLHGPTPPPPPVPLYLGPACEQVMVGLGRAFGAGEEFWEGAFVLRQYDPAAGLDIGGMRVTFAPTRHYIDCWAMRFEGGGATLAYTADTGPDVDLEPLAQGADCLLAECSLPARAGYEADWGHLAPGEVGAMAAAADVKRLLMTHSWFEHDRAGLVAGARGTYGGPVAMAQEMDVHVFP